MKRILVIEDEPFMLRNLLAALTSKDFGVIGAEDGCRGLELARSQVPDLILCDITMPGKNGYEVLRELRLDPETCDPFIFLAAGGHSDFRAGMNLGATITWSNPSAPKICWPRSKRFHGNSRRSFFDRTFHRRSDPFISSSEPLQTLGLTRREAEILLWVANGKTNPEIAVIPDQPRHGEEDPNTSSPNSESKRTPTRTALETLAQRSIRP